MQDTTPKNKNTAADEASEASYGGSRYKRNYDKYKASGTKGDALKSSSVNGGVITAVSVAAFVLLIVCLALFVVNTILQTKGMSLFAVFSHASETAPLPPQTSEQTSDKAAGAALDETVTVEITNQTGSVSGRGVVLTADGYIVTCSDLISGALNISVVLFDGRVAPAYAVGLDESKGVSVIKADVEGLSVARIGDSSAVSVGETLFTSDVSGKTLAENSFAGIVSSDARVKLSGKVACPIGCPVLNASGEVVAIISGPDQAIPMSEALTSINEMINSGNAMLVTDESSAEIDLLGITVRSVTDQLSDIYNIPTGCYVVNVSVIGSPIKKGDIIVSADGKTVSDAEQLAAALSSSGSLSVYRTNRYIDIAY